MEEQPSGDLKQLLGMVSQSTKSNITDWKNEPSVSDLMADITNARFSHSEQISKINKWLDIIYTDTDTKRVHQKGRSGISPKVVRRLAEWRYGALSTAFLNEKKLFTVNAYHPNYLQAAVQNELVLNFQFNALINKVKFINDLVRTAVNEGTAIIRVGWEVATQIKETEIPVYQYQEADPQQAQMITEVMQQVQMEMQQSGAEHPEDTKSFGSIPEDLQESIKASVEYGRPVVAVDTGRTQKQKNEVMVRNRPEVKVIPNSSLIIDPSCEGDFDKAKFAVYVYKSSLSELKQQGIYTNLDEAMIGTTLPENIADVMNMPDDVYASFNGRGNTGNSFNFKDKARKQVTVYEYWGYYDIDGTGITQAIVATIVNNTVIRMERSPFPDNKLPFVVIPYLPIKGSVYGEPDAELVKDNQDVIKSLTRAAIDINARSANGQVARPKGFLDAVNADKFNKGEDYEYNPMNIHPAEAIYMHTANELPQSLLVLLQQHYAEAEAATGVKSFQGGIDGNAYGQTVSGMSQAVTAMTQRESDILFRLSKGLEEVGNKIVAMNSLWLNEEEVIAISQSEFVSIKKEDLAGDFYLDVSIKSNSESEGKAQQLTFLMQTLGNNIPFDMTKMFLVEICRLYNLDTIRGMIQDYEPQPQVDPFHEKMQELHIIEKEAKIKKLQDEAEYFQARSNYIQAQVGNVHADTDQKNLDFLEQQEGVKHERQKQIVEAQAAAQNKGKLAQELLKGDNAQKVAMLNSQSKAQHANKKLGKGIPNPERYSLPEGLYTADGLGNYIRGDGHTVGNET